MGALHDRSFAFETPTKLEDIKDWSLGTRNIDLSFPSHSSKGILSRNEKEGLIELYSRLYSVQSSSVEIPSSYVKYREVTLNGKLIGTRNSRSKNSSIVMSAWVVPLLLKEKNTTSPAPSLKERPVCIEFFIKHTVHIQQKSLAHILFSASWFKEHSRQTSFGSPITVWESDIFESSIVSSLIPIQFIKSRTVSLIDTLDDSLGQAMFVIPIIDF